MRVGSSFAKDCDIIGAPIWRSPEAQLQVGWGTPTDIWSFGTVVRALSQNRRSLFCLYTSANKSPSMRSLYP